MKVKNFAASTSAIYQGTTSPAAASIAVGLRPSTSLRCGKRPNRSMMS
jgi:hypothetical protein